MSPDILLALAAGIILVLAHAIPWMAGSHAKLVENPAKLAAALSAMHVLPHYAIVMIWPEESAIYALMRGDLYLLLAKFGLYYALGICALLYGIKIGIKEKSYTSPINVNLYPNYYVASLLSFSAYIAVIFIIISNVGGISSFLGAAGTQNEFQSGMGVFNMFKMPAAYLAILFIAVQHARTGKPRFIWVALYILLIVGIESSFGSRRTPIQLVIFAVVSIYMVRPERKLLSITNLVMASICVAIFVVLLNIRDEVSGYVEERTFASYVINFSYNDIYMFVLHHFSNNDFWLGKVFLDFKYKISGGIQGLPPPSLDEGVYIYNLYLGRPVEPPLPVEMMAHNSWPPRTFGNGYMNFGFFGIIVFSFIQGLLTGWAYKVAVRTGRHPIFLFLFLLFIFSFQVSNLKLTEMISVLIGLTIMFGPMYLIERRSRLGRASF